MVNGAGSVFLSPNSLLNVSVMMFSLDLPSINAFGIRLFYMITDIIGISLSNAFAITWYVEVGLSDVLSWLVRTTIIRFLQ